MGRSIPWRQMSTWGQCLFFPWGVNVASEMQISGRPMSGRSMSWHQLMSTVGAWKPNIWIPNVLISNGSVLEWSAMTIYIVMLPTIPKPNHGNPNNMIAILFGFPMVLDQMAAILFKTEHHWKTKPHWKIEHWATFGAQQTTLTHAICKGVWNLPQMTQCHFAIQISNKMVKNSNGTIRLAQLLAHWTGELALRFRILARNFRITLKRTA